MCPGGDQPQAVANRNESNSRHDTAWHCMAPYGTAWHGMARDDLPRHAVSTACPTLPGSHSDAGISSRRESLFRLCAALASCHRSIDPLASPRPMAAALAFQCNLGRHSMAEDDHFSAGIGQGAMPNGTPPVFPLSMKAPVCFHASVCMTPKVSVKSIRKPSRWVMVPTSPSSAPVVQ